MEFSNADAVPESGEFRCSACGAAQQFEAGDDFTICDECGDESAGWESAATSLGEEGLEKEEDMAAWR